MAKATLDEARKKKILKLAREGKTEEQIAEEVGVCRKTLLNWRKADPSYEEEVRKAKDEADEKVVHALYKKCLGFEHGGKYYPPDITAIALWLCNRRPSEWKNRREYVANNANANLNITPEQSALGTEYLKSAQEFFKEFGKKK